MEGVDLVEYHLKCEEDIVNILHEYFQKQQYYVEVGDVLVTVNPWKPFDLVKQETKNFLQRTKTAGYENQPLPPHPCSVAEKVVRNGSDGVIIPLGESGSGKSKNIRMILNYLSLRLDAQEVLSNDEILAINEALDLFCSAKTLICNNSTRSLIIYEAFFDSKQQKLLGVRVNIRVLEKLRVVNQIKGEGNFHIFHRLLHGLSAQQLHEYCLDMDHRFVPSLTDKDHHQGNANLSQSLKCLETIGFDEKEIEDMLHLLSAIILLGDLQFAKSSKRDVLSFRNGDVLEEAANLLGIPCATLAGMIITSSKIVQGEKFNISASCSKAICECDRLAVICYETLVMFIETRINTKYAAYSRLQSDFSLSLLDVFGWENYTACSFDQLCVNAVNEALQSTYNAVVFKTYQMGLEDENIYLNEPCLRFDQPGAVPLLFKPKGILDVLHSNIDSKYSNDQQLLKKLDTSFKKEPRYVTNNNQEITGFIIEHFAGEVLYDMTGFVARSRNGWFDTNVLTSLKGSKNKVVSIMSQERITRENTSSERHFSPHSSSQKKSLVERDWLKTTTFLSNFGKQKKKYSSVNKSSASQLTISLTSFLHRISSSKVYFIRCINSNLGMQPEVFDRQRVLRQVKWSQLYGTVKTRMPSLKICFSLLEFITRYKLLFFDVSQMVSVSPELCHSILSKTFDESQYKVGKTKVFLSRDLLSKLDMNLRKALHLVILIQKTFRGFLGRKQYQNMIEVRNKYDEGRSVFFSQMTAGISKFHDHLNLQINEDERRLRENMLKDEQTKFDANESKITSNNQPVTSPRSHDRRVSYAWGDELIFDETAESLTWCKILCFQRTRQMSEFSVKDPKVVIDGTNHSFTTDRIGFNSFPTPNRDTQMKKVKSCIGRGVELYLSKDGSLNAMRLCKNPIFVKGHFCEEKLLKTLGELPRRDECKVFDYKTFIEKINFQCHPARLAVDSEDRCLAMCAVHLCFIKNSQSDEEAPCWVEIILSQAMQYVKNVISFSMQRRREVQEKYHFQQPPALRMDSKMESASAKMLQLIRPSRYIETVKFKRKDWARKRVVSNPFLYGEDSFSDDNGSKSIDSPGSREETMFESNEEVSNSSEKQELYENVRIENSQDRREISQSENSYDSTYSGKCEIDNVETKWQNFFELSQVKMKKDNAPDYFNEKDGNTQTKVESSLENDRQNIYEDVQRHHGNGETQFFSDVSATDKQNDPVFETLNERSKESHEEHYDVCENFGGGLGNVKIFHDGEAVVSGVLHNRKENKQKNEAEVLNSSIANVDLLLTINQKKITNVNIAEDNSTGYRDNEDFYVNVRMDNVCERSENQFDKSFQEIKNTLMDDKNVLSGVKDEIYLDFKRKVQLHSNLSDTRNKESPVFSTPKNMSLNYTSVHSEMKEREDKDEREVTNFKPAPPGRFSDVHHLVNSATISTESENHIQRNIPRPDYMDNDSPTFMNLLKQDEDVVKDKEAREQEEKEEVIYEAMTKTNDEEYYVNYSSSQHARRGRMSYENLGTTGQQSLQNTNRHQMSFSRF